MDLKSLQSKISLLDLKLRYAAKKLPFRLKVVFILLLFLFVISGLGILYQVDQKLSISIPAEGGTFTEGIIGTPRFVNPVLTISDADRDLAMLIYSGLMRINNNSLVYDLAEKYEISEDGLCYKFTLKPKTLWSDGHPLTSDDIVFTIDKIQNPDTKSPKRASWEGVKVRKIDDRTTEFCLQKPYAPFLENTTLGILPKHIWQDILPEQMPLSNFNIEAIGSGPYKIKNIIRNSSGIITSYTLIANENFTINKPYINKFTLKFYPSEKKLSEAYQNKEIDNLSAVSPQEILRIKMENSPLKTYLLPRVFGVFFNQDDAPIFANKTVRQALELATDKEKIIKEVLGNFGIAINSPIPPGSLGAIEFSNDYENFDQQIEQAKEILSKQGWKLNEEENVLEKKDKKETTKLEFSLSTSNIPELVQTAQLLKQMWENIGAKVNLKIYETGDLEKEIIRSRDYDSLLFGEIVGREPDVFAFWHSSQRNDPGLNIALYANITTDKLLEKARGTLDIAERKKIYEEFQKEIIKDAPAIFIYSPRFIYLVTNSISGLNQESITVSSERFSQIHNWYIKTQKVWKTFLD